MQSETIAHSLTYSLTGVKCRATSVAKNYDFCDENNNNVDDYGDENYQKTDKYHGFLLKIYPFKARLFGKKRDQNKGSIPPLNRQCPFKKKEDTMDVFPSSNCVYFTRKSGTKGTMFSSFLKSPIKFG